MKHISAKQKAKMIDGIIGLLRIPIAFIIANLFAYLIVLFLNEWFGFRFQNHLPWL